MIDFDTFIAELGGLHDCTVLKLIIDSARGHLILEIVDLHFNFEGLPEYKGSLPSRMIFSGVGGLSLDCISSTENLHIHDFEMGETISDVKSVSIGFWPEGKMVFTYKKVVVESGARLIWPS